MVNKFSRDNNCLFVFDYDGFSIQDSTIEKICLWELSKNGLHPFPLFAYAFPSYVCTPTAFLGVKTIVGTWHQCLDHPTGSTFQNLLVSLPFSGFASAPFCKYCQLAKSYKLLFSTSHFVTNKSLELIHSDVWGPSPLSSSYGFEYYVIFIDDFSNILGFIQCIVNLIFTRSLLLLNCK